MAQKKKNRDRKIHDERIQYIIQHHIQELGLESIDTYKTWCRENHFSSSIHKTSLQRQKEINFAKTAIAVQHLTAEKKCRNLKDIIPQIYAEKIKETELKNRTAREIFSAFKSSKFRKVLFNLLMYLEENSDILNEHKYIKGIEAIANHHLSWVRPIEDWYVKRHNRSYQFKVLLRHLFAAYDIPDFMDCVWMTDNECHQNWYIHIGLGQNIRTAPDLPTLLTKKMAHHFLQTPKQYSVEEALRWGQVHALGGDRRLAEALRGTQVIKDFKHDDFWMNLFRFFIQNPMLDVSHVHPIVDYIWSQKFQERRVYVDIGVEEVVDPPQPNFSMNGRTPATLLRQVNDWHRELGRATSGGELQWGRSDIGEFLYRIMRKQKKSKIWQIRELLSTDELFDEGRRMNHCVGSYGHSCFKGIKSIWTMESKEEDEKTQKLLTIEVLMENKRINQVRGKGNRLPTVGEMSVLNRWAAKEDLSIAAYVRAAE